MTRAEAIKALIAGKKVERVAEHRGDSLKLRWDEAGGIEIENTVTGALTGGWLPESGGADFTYREVFEPRVFLDVWEEVKTFEEAEKANEDGSKRFMWDSVDEEISPFNSNIGMSQGDCWVRRKATP